MKTFGITEEEALKAAEAFMAERRKYSLLNHNAQVLNEALVIMSGGGR